MSDDGAEGYSGEDTGAQTGGEPGAQTGEDSGTQTGEDQRSESGGDAELTHTDEAGAVEMVGVGDKPATDRRAVARGEIRLEPSTVAAVRDNEVGKGDVLAVARVGAVQGVKHTWEAVPMCHQIPVTDVDTSFELGEDRIELAVAVETTARTGPEMEALQGVTTGLSVVWDMVKSAEKDDAGQYPDTAIEGVEVVEKHTGRE